MSADAAGSGRPTTESGSQRNPWPCERCGTPIRIAAGAGRLGLWASLALGAIVVTVWLGLTHFDPPPVSARWAGVVGLEIVVAWALVRRRRRRAWTCDGCGHCAPARSRPAETPSVAVAIPTFDNVDSIAAVVGGVIAAAPDAPLYVVDDGSGDGTGAAAEAAIRAALASSVERVVLRHPHNLGKGVAIVTALERAFAAGCSHLVTLDGDGQHLPGDLPQVRVAIERDPTALWVGARDLSGPNVEGASRFGRAFSNFWLRILGGARIDDSQSGFRAYPTAPVLSLGLRARRFDFEVEVLTRAARARMRIGSVPVRVHYPPAGERVSHFDKLWDNVRISLLNTRLLSSLPLWALRWPPRFDDGPAPSTIVRPWTGRSFGGRLGHAIFVLVLRRLGLRPARWLLVPVSLYFVLVHRQRCRSTLPVLEAILGPTGAGGRFVRSLRNTLAFARTLLDTAAVRVLGPGAVTFTSEGREHLEQALAGGRGAVLVTAHFGNNALASRLLAASPGGERRVHLVVLDAEAEAIRRVHQSSEQKGDGAARPELIAVNRGEIPSLRILRALRDGDVVAMGGDRVIDKNWMAVDFFGRPTAFPTGPVTIAAAARAPLLFATTVAESPGVYRFTCEAPREVVLRRAERDQDLREHVEWLAHRIEAAVRQSPYQWFNFYDFWELPQESSRGGREP